MMGNVMRWAGRPIYMSNEQHGQRHRRSNGRKRRWWDHATAILRHESWWITRINSVASLLFSCWMNLKEGLFMCDDGVVVWGADRPLTVNVWIPIKFRMHCVVEIEQASVECNAHMLIRMIISSIKFSKYFSLAKYVWTYHYLINFVLTK